MVQKEQVVIVQDAYPSPYAAAAPPPSAGNAWEVVHNGGQTYYVNTQTRVTAWTLPPGAHIASVNPLAAAGSTA